MEIASQAEYAGSIPVIGSPERHVNGISAHPNHTPNGHFGRRLTVSRRDTQPETVCCVRHRWNDRPGDWFPRRSAGSQLWPRLTANPPRNFQAVFLHDDRVAHVDGVEIPFRVLGAEADAAVTDVVMPE